ncbi:ranBP-type and C3HC4-type zinc finger-containing protein 1-like [Papaver somniferum]|uniref:ranBP-type and C3HC4-type zinc finger-containing protein 1-like n=1 Tax=Papaver somniferum TaxID=3469 RepID=UPI000E6F5895|nr:ranBP-type and C3HC4-type zinc finger-containing protein 1-like [Papaver somniferum]
MAAELGKRSTNTTSGSSSTSDCVDSDVLGDFNLALLSEDHGGNEMNIPISDAQFAENLWIQEALMASFHKLKQTQIIRSEVQAILQGDPDGSVLGAQSLGLGVDTTTSTAAAISKRIKQEAIVKVKLEKLESAETICGSCKEMKTMGEMFIRYGTATTSTCTHRFCFECLRKHIVARIQENEIVIRCPGFECGEILESGLWQGLIPKEVFDRWGEAVSGSFFAGSVVIYCPFGDCNGMLVNDGGGDAIRETECMHCRRLFCAQCKVPWHSDTNCGDFQKLVGENGAGDI